MANNHKCAIIADPSSSGWDFASKLYEKIRDKTDKFELNKVNIKKFRDKEIKPKIELNIRNKDCYFIHDSNKDPKSWFLELCLINSAIKGSSAERIIDVLPYLRFCRQDRKDESRVPISAKVVSDVIGIYADRVLTMDVHSHQIQGFYNIPFDNLYSFPTVISNINQEDSNILDNSVIMSTDAGGASRAKSFAERAGKKEVAIGYKVRNKDGDVETLKILGEVKNKNVLILDDIVDSGTTINMAAYAARMNGANKVYGYCTHGLFTKGIEYVTKNFDTFFLGDTLYNNNPPKNTRIISFVPLFAEAIYRINEGKSLSELFE